MVSEQERASLRLRETFALCLITRENDSVPL